MLTSACWWCYEITKVIRIHPVEYVLIYNLLLLPPTFLHKYVYFLLLSTSRQVRMQQRNRCHKTRAGDATPFEVWVTFAQKQPADEQREHFILLSYISEPVLLFECLAINLLKALQQRTMLIFLRITGQMESMWCYCMICNSSQQPYEIKIYHTRGRERAISHKQQPRCTRMQCTHKTGLELFCGYSQISTKYLIN